MNKLKAIIATSLLSIVTLPVFASDKPAACPSAEALKKTNPTFLQYQSDENVYVIGTVSKFETSHKWVMLMVIPGDQAVSLHDALNKAETAYPTITGTPKPVRASGKAWRCKYLNSFDYQVVLYTPPSNGSEDEGLHISKSALKG